MHRLYRFAGLLLATVVLAAVACGSGNSAENEAPDKKIMAKDKDGQDKGAATNPVALYTTLWTIAEYNDTITSAAFHPDGKTVAVGADAADTTIRFHHTRDGRMYKTIGSPYNWHLAFAPDGKTLISGGLGTIKYWEVATGADIRTIDGVSISLRSLELSPDGQILVTGGLDKEIRFWRAATGDPLKRINIKGFCWFNAFSPDGRYLATGGNPDIQVIDTRSDTVILTLKGYIYDPMNTANNDTFAAVFTPDGKFLITGGADRVIRFWEMPSGKLVKQLEKQSSVIRELALTPDGNRLVAGNYIDLVIWDTATGTIIQTIPGIKQTSALKISPDGNTMVTGGVDRILRLWRIGG